MHISWHNSNSCTKNLVLICTTYLYQETLATDIYFRTVTTNKVETNEPSASRETGDLQIAHSSKGIPYSS